MQRTQKLFCFTVHNSYWFRALVAEQVKPCLADLGVRSLIPGRSGKLFTINGVPLLTAFHYHPPPPIVVIWPECRQELLDKREYLVIIRDNFVNFAWKHVVAPHLNHFDETVQMRGHTIWFGWEIRKIIIKYSLLSRALMTEILLDRI